VLRLRCLIDAFMRPLIDQQILDKQEEHFYHCHNRYY
jgi:hypothetical protein